MASTRNRNTRGNYVVEQLTLAHRSDRAVDIVLPTATCLPGQALIGFGAPGPTLDRAFCDTESMLRGIGATNLVQDTVYESPQPVALPFLNLVPQRAAPPVPTFAKETKQERPMYLN